MTDWKPFKSLICEYKNKKITQLSFMVRWQIEQQRQGIEAPEARRERKR